MKSEQNLALSRRAFVGAAATIGAATALTATNPLDAYAVTAAEKKAQAEAALSKVKMMESQLGEASRNSELAKSAEDEAQQKIDEAQGRIDEASEQIGDLQEQLGTRARSMYRSGSASFLDLLLGATSFQAFTNNWSILNNMNEDDAEMVEQTKTLRAEVQEQKAVVEQEKEVAASEAQKAETIKNDAQALLDEYEASYNSLSAEAAALLEQEKKASEEADRAAAIREQQQMQASGNGNKKPGSNGGGSYNNDKVPSVSGSIVVNRAAGAIGKPYRSGAVGPDAYDCSGLVSYALTGQHKRIGVSGSFGAMTRVSNPQPGDICCGPGHVGIFVSPGTMIHAPQEGQTVCYSSIQKGMWYTRY